MAFLDYSGLSHFLDKIKALFVTGPGSSTNNNVAIYDGTTGKKVKDSGYTIGKSVPSNAVFTDTTYESKSASSGGTDVSLVTTGEKYTWNNKKNTQSAVSDPSASGTSVTFIDSISQNTQGVISPTKKTISTMAGASSSTAGSAGLVPAPAAGDEAKALLGNGTWGTVSTSDMVGATSSAAGTHGLVPAPAAGDQTKVLTGAGTWVTTKNVQAAVSNPYASGESISFIDGISQNTQGVISPTKKYVRQMQGATSTSDGSAGLVPAPAAGNLTKFLKSDGTWAIPNTAMLQPASAIPIPSEGNITYYAMQGITSNHVLVLWQYSDSPENYPPADLMWYTDNGVFGIGNASGTTDETIQPIFVLPNMVTTTSSV